MHFPSKTHPFTNRLTAAASVAAAATNTTAFAFFPSFSISFSPVLLLSLGLFALMSAGMSEQVLKLYTSC